MNRRRCQDPPWLVSPAVDLAVGCGGWTAPLLALTWMAAGRGLDPAPVFYALALVCNWAPVGRRARRTQALWFVVPTLPGTSAASGLGPAYFSAGVLAFGHCAQYLWIAAYAARRDPPGFRPARYATLLVVGGAALFLPVPWVVSWVAPVPLSRGGAALERSAGRRRRRRRAPPSRPGAGDDVLLRASLSHPITPPRPILHRAVIPTDDTGDDGCSHRSETAARNASPGQGTVIAG